PVRCHDTAQVLGKTDKSQCVIVLIEQVQRHCQFVRGEAVGRIQLVNFLKYLPCFTQSAQGTKHAQHVQIVEEGNCWRQFECLVKMQFGFTPPVLLCRHHAKRDVCIRQLRVQRQR